jgi:RHS repeat-associated protein
MRRSRIVLVAALALGAGLTASGQGTTPTTITLTLTTTTGPKTNFTLTYDAVGFGNDAVKVSITPSSGITLLNSGPFSTQTGSVSGSASENGYFSVTVADLVTGVTINATYPGTPPAAGASQLNTVSDPIATATGELIAPDLPPDLALGGPLPLRFQRYYGSLIGVDADGATTRLGTNWAHNFDWSLNFNGPYAQVVAPDGLALLFQQSGNAWQLIGPEQYDYQLVTTATNTYQFLDPRSNLTYTFAGTGTTLGLSTIQDRNGNTLTITAPVGNSSQASDGLGRSLTFTYSASGNVIEVADQTGRSITFSYTADKYGKPNLTQSTDAAGNVRTYTYTTAGLLDGLMTGRTLPLGNVPYTQTFDSTGRAVTQTDSRGNVTNVAYDQPPGSTVDKDPLGNATTYAAINHSEFSGYTDPGNNSFSIAYDSSGHRTSVTDRLGATTSRTYQSPSGYVASETNAAGNTTTYTWTSQAQGPFSFFNLTQIQYSDGTSVSFTYDASGNAISATDQAGNVWTYTYNSRGQRISVTEPLGRVTTYAYNASDATLASVTDAAGNVTTYSYDALKRVIEIKFADGTTRSFTYDNLDNVLTSTDERGNVTTLTFNANDELATATDPLGKSDSFAYDTDDQLSKGTDRTGASTSYTYDQNQLLNTLTTPALETFTFTYDTHHRLASALDPSGKGLTFAYDKEDVLASSTDALSRTTLFTTDNLGYRTKITTPLGENYAIARDTLERVTGLTDPTGVATSIAYDPRGLVSGIANGGLAAALVHDSSGSLTSLSDPNGNAWNFGYDKAGRLASRNDPLKRSTTYSYDQRNRVNGVTTPVGTGTFAYDAAGNLIGRVYSDGTNLSYTYDNDNQLLTAPGATLSYDADGRVTGSNGVVTTYDADGRVASITYAAGKTVTYAYNAVALLASMTDWISGSTTFTYDAAHELVTMTRPNGLSTHYTYDRDGRLASITEDAGSSIVITRDAAGKIVSESRTQPQSPSFAPGVLPLTFDNADEVSGSGSTYDGMARLITDALRSYTWDLASRLTSYTGVNGSATAVSDGFGLRTSETAAGVTSNFVWNYATGLATVAIVRSASVDQRYYVYTPGGELLYAIDAPTNARHYYHFDETGSIVLLTNDAGTVTDSYGTTPFGETVTQNGTTPNPFTWLGQFGVMQEGSTGLYYMRARWYDSATARFLSPDPLLSADPMQVNPYQYARNNPLSYIDPTGTAYSPSFGPTDWNGNKSTVKCYGTTVGFIESSGAAASWSYDNLPAGDPLLDFCNWKKKPPEEPRKAKEFPGRRDPWNATYMGLTPWPADDGTGNYPVPPPAAVPPAPPISQGLQSVVSPSLLFPVAIFDTGAVADTSTDLASSSSSSGTVSLKWWKFRVLSAGSVLFPAVMLETAPSGLVHHWTLPSNRTAVNKAYPGFNF